MKKKKLKDYSDEELARMDYNTKERLILEDKIHKIVKYVLLAIIVIFLIITLCGSIYVRLVFSSFLMLPLIKVGVTLENSHINSIRCFRHSSNCNSCLIIFIYLHHPFDWMIFILFIGNKKINQILFSDWFCIYLFNLVRTDTSLVLMVGLEPTWFPAAFWVF